MADESTESPQRWTAKRRVALVLRLLKGETSAEGLTTSRWSSSRWNMMARARP
jgi:hypothetical protein